MRQQELRIEAYRVPVKPDYKPLARHLLEKMIKWYEDPEHMREYEEWKKERERTEQENG